MGCEVYANGMTIACKVADGKTIAATPDVCLSPPPPPAGPVPIPYPNTAVASDTTKGSKSVQIGGQEVMLKNKSTFKKSTGDEAATKSLGMGVVSHQIQGEVNFCAWSMDVKFESENVPRHLDLTLHNEMCSPANTPPWPYVDGQAFPANSVCSGDKAAKDAACSNEDPCPGVLKLKPGDLKGQVAKAPSKRLPEVSALDSTPRGSESRTSKAARAATKEANHSECVKKSRCHLRPYEPKEGEAACCPGQTPHHIPPKACFKGVKKYSKGAALCVCMEGASQHFGSHGKNHAAIDYLAKQQGIKADQKCTIADYNKICAQAVAAQCGCNADCIEQQLNQSLAPTNRNIKHVHSTSKEPLDSTLKDKLDETLGTDYSTLNDI
jgi:hypothetical protein